MKNVIYVIPLKFLKFGVETEHRQLLENHGITLLAIAKLCLEYYKVFCNYDTGRLMVADPLFITYVVKEKRSGPFDEYVLNAVLNTDPKVRYPLEKVLEMVAMIAYILLLDIENKLNEIVNGSGYDVRDIHFDVRYCDYDRIEVEFKYAPANPRSPRF